MSKDIRSYFSVSPRNAKQPDGNQRKRTKQIIISDSESESEDLTPKKGSTSKSPSSVKKGGERNKKNEEKSRYFENVKPVKPADVFGSSSVKRSGVPAKQNKEPKNKDKISFNDDEFDATLMQIDDKSMELLIKEGSSGKKSENDLKSNKSNFDKAAVSKKTSEHERGSQITPNGVSDGKDKNSKTDHSVLSESSDSEDEVKPPKKIKVDKTRTTSPKKFPEKKSIKPEKKVFEKKKNECIDLSESDSEQETSVNNSKLSVVSEKDKPPKSQKEQNVVKDSELKTGLKRIRDNDRLDDDDDFIKQKKQKKVIPYEINPVKVYNLAPKVSIVSNLWVDKYKPTSIKQLIGQQGEKSCVKKLLNWLNNWKRNHNGKTKLHKPSPWAKDDDGSFFKAALLSGPPGIGKTTTAHLVCKELNFDVVEFNASDTRSKKSLQQEVSELLSTKSLAPYFSGGCDKEVTSNHVLIMDEVDGMAGNEDRGGVQELIQLIKSSRIPIICMCNDRNHPKMRSLVNYCYDLRFSRPRVEQIKGAMMSVCFKEGLKISPDQLMDVIKSTNQDIRLILNHLSVLAAQKDSSLPNSEKFVKLGPWDVLRKVFSEEELKKMSFYDKSDLFFHDYSIAPLFVHENYLSVVPHAKLNKIEKMQVFAKAAESICTGDIVEKVIRTRNAWTLLPVEAIFASVLPGETLKGHIGSQINFPSWLGKNSSRNKMDRLQQELLIHTRLKASGSKEAINLDYSSHLRELIVRPLVQNGSEGVMDALNALQSYNLLKEDLENLSELCKWPKKKDPMEKVESKVKAAFTRAYNKSTNLSPYAVTAAVKKGRGVGGGPEMETDDLLFEDNEENAVLEGEDDEDNIEVDAMIVAKKKAPKNQQLLPSTSKQRGSGKKVERGRKK